MEEWIVVDYKIGKLKTEKRVPYGLGIALLSLGCIFILGVVQVIIEYFIS